MEELKNEPIDIKVDIGRILFGLSRIGYNTVSAITDIIDNSVSAKATQIHVLIEKDRKDFSDKKRNNVKEYTIIDNGKGMSEAEILEALTLGSTEKNYEKNSLSKFGLGLKSAAFSQSDKLQIISSNGESNFNKYVVDLSSVIREKKYFALKDELDQYDNEVISEYLKENRGTIIRLTNVRKINHPSVNKTVDELNLKLGVIYYYFLKDNLKIFILNKEIGAIDPLFSEEANENGNLDEHIWDGKDVRWIEKRRELLLDDEEGIKVDIEITQLPYPPIFNLTHGKGEDKKIRDKYLIGSGNYGFYVYRNKRLISWASQLQGIISNDQDYFAFRGRILIDDSADDYFNIDVKKSTLTLSDEAWNVISDFTQEAKRKSRNAWLTANNHRLEFINQQPNEISNIIIKDFEQLEILPGDEIIDESQALQRLKTIEDDMQIKAKEMIKRAIEDEGDTYNENTEISEEIKEKAIKGEVNEKLSKIFRVSSIFDNLLWEPYYDTDKGNCVRINKYHRFARQIFEENHLNQDLQVLFDLLLLQFSEAELYAYKHIEKYEYEELKNILTEFRRISSELLANLCRKLENQLPPNYKSDLE